MQHKLVIIVFLVVAAVLGTVYFLYKVSPASLPKKLDEVLPSPAETPFSQPSIQSSLEKSVIEDLAKRLNENANKISVVTIEAANWRDGSLGCPEPGKVYTQATTSGYEVILESVGKTYTYHAVNNVHFVYCDEAWHFSCTEDAQCGLNICDCKAMFSPYIRQQDKICTRFCPGTPKCINNKCQLVK